MFIYLQLYIQDYVHENIFSMCFLEFYDNMITFASQYLKDYVRIQDKKGNK